MSSIKNRWWFVFVYNSYLLLTHPSPPPPPALCPAGEESGLSLFEQKLGVVLVPLQSHSLRISRLHSCLLKCHGPRDDFNGRVSRVTWQCHGSCVSCWTISIFQILRFRFRYFWTMLLLWVADGSRYFSFDSFYKTLFWHRLTFVFGFIIIENQDILPQIKHESFE